MTVYNLKELTQAGKKELALALVLWKDFKANSGFDIDIILQMYQLSDMLGVHAECDEILKELPAMKIVPR